MMYFISVVIIIVTTLMFVLFERIRLGSDDKSCRKGGYFNSETF